MPSRQINDFFTKKIELVARPEFEQLGGQPVLSKLRSTPAGRRHHFNPRLPHCNLFCGIRVRVSAGGILPPCFKKRHKVCSHTISKFIISIFLRFFAKKMLIDLEGTLFLPFLQQLPRLSLGPLNGSLSCHGTL